MSPASRSKSKDKKAGKEPPKGSSKSSGHVSSSSGIPASGYNPLLGTFHTFETAPVPSASPLHVNSRFRNIDDTDDHNGNSSGTGNDFDSVSNNGSWSGESEDHKEKTSQPLQRSDLVPGSDNDKREKIRQKNERKHQRQKERRAQELHERCSGYLMSRKLEALAQQLVAMGFSQERATMALILNEGRVEESVAWLFEGGEEDKQVDRNVNGGGNLKIDISEELARITDMEIRYKASKQEVERAVVSFEGDLDKAEETLKAQKEEPPSVPPKPEETGDPPSVANNSKLPMGVIQNPIRIQAKPTPSTLIQQRRDERDFNYTKAPATLGSSSVDPGAKMQLLKKVPPKSDWTKPEQITVPPERRSATASAGSNRTSSFSLASSLMTSPSPAKTEAHYVSVGTELKNLQLGSVKEPVIVMQRPQSANMKQQTRSSSPPGTTMGWYPNSAETMRPPNGFVPPVPVSRNFSSNGVSSNPIYNQPPHYQPQQQFDSLGRGNGLWSRGTSLAPALTPASSLGLFSGRSTNSTSGSSSSPVDWSMGSSMSSQLDYTNVDWSLDPASLQSRPNGLWSGGSSYPVQSNNRSAYDSFGVGPGVRSASMRMPMQGKGNGAVVQGLGDGVANSSADVAAGGGSREWTSPFEEKDIFSLPRQFVSSPSL